MSRIEVATYTNAPIEVLLTPSVANPVQITHGLYVSWSLSKEEACELAKALLSVTR